MLSIFKLLINSSNIYYAPNYSVPGTSLSIRYSAVNKKVKMPALMSYIPESTYSGFILPPLS